MVLLPIVANEEVRIARRVMHSSKTAVCTRGPYGVYTGPCTRVSFEEFNVFGVDRVFDFSHKPLLYCFVPGDPLSFRLEGRGRG